MTRRSASAENRRAYVAFVLRERVLLAPLGLLERIRNARKEYVLSAKIGNKAG